MIKLQKEDLIRNIKSLKIKLKESEVFQDIKKVIFILGLTFLFLIAWANRVNLYPDNLILWSESKIKSFSVKSEFPCRFEGEKVMAENFQFKNGYILALSNNSFNVFSKKGKKMLEEKHNFSTPILKSSGNRSIIFDLGGKSFKIVGMARNIHSGTTEHEIMGAAISEGGDYALVTRSQKYLYELNVYNKNNVLKFKLPFSEHYITDIDFNSLSSELIVAGISSRNGNPFSNVFVINTASKKVKSQFELKDNIVNKVKYFLDGNFVAIGNEYCAVIDPNSKQIYNKNYGEKSLKCYRIYEDGSILLNLASSINENAENLIIGLDEKAKETLHIKSNYNFTDLTFSGQKIICLMRDKIISYNTNGTYDGYIESDENYKKILPISDHKIYVLGIQNIDKLKLSDFKREDS